MHSRQSLGVHGGAGREAATVTGGVHVVLRGGGGIASHGGRSDLSTRIKSGGGGGEQKNAICKRQLLAAMFGSG